MSLNKVLLIGNVGKDPEIRAIQGGTSIATFTLATTDRYKDRNGEAHEDTEWHTIVCWGKTAEFVENYVAKGSQLYVEGKLRTRSYDDNNGQKRYVTEIRADNIQLLGKREKQDTTPAPAPNTATSRPARRSKPEPLDPQSDDLPFRY